MDFIADSTTLILAIFFLVTLPLLFLALRLRQAVRVLQRIENMNLRSMQRWP